MSWGIVGPTDAMETGEGLANTKSPDEDDDDDEDADDEDAEDENDENNDPNVVIVEV